MEALLKAYGYVIFPNVGKGGFIIGGAAGNGAVYESSELVGFAKLSAEHRIPSRRTSV
jgi:lipid-binding SYLF domain-containing protein